MKKIYWMLVLIGLLALGLVDWSLAKRSPGYTVQVTFAGMPGKQAATVLASTIMNDLGKYDPVATIAKDGEL